MKIIWENNNMLYITNGQVVRVIHLTTWNASETTNQSIINKVIKNGERIL